MACFFRSVVLAIVLLVYAIERKLAHARCLKMVEESSDGSFLRYLLPRYFVHGLLFSIFGLIIDFVLIFVLLGLIIVGALIGLIIGIIILFFVFGAVNVFLMDRIWNIQVKENWMSLLVHGFALVTAFLVVSIPSFIIDFYAASLPTEIVLSIIYCFIDGYIAKAVGSYWKEEGEGPRAIGRTTIQLGFMGTLAVILLTAMAGTGFAIGLLLLVWSLLGGTFIEYLLYLAVIAGLVTLVGIIILTFSKRESQEED